MSVKITSKEDKRYHLTNILKCFNYVMNETTLNNVLYNYGPYPNFFQSNWAILLKKFVKTGTNIISVQGDRLEQISNVYYNTTSLWPILQLFNPHINNPFIIAPGTMVFIPNFDDVDAFFGYLAMSVQNKDNTNKTNILEF